MHNIGKLTLEQRINKKKKEREESLSKVYEHTMVSSAVSKDNPA